LVNGEISSFSGVPSLISGGNSVFSGILSLISGVTHTFSGDTQYKLDSLTKLKSAVKTLYIVFRENYSGRPQKCLSKTQINKCSNQ